MTNRWNELGSLTTPDKRIYVVLDISSTETGVPTGSRMQKNYCSLTLTPWTMTGRPASARSSSSSNQPPPAGNQRIDFPGCFQCLRTTRRPSRLNVQLIVRKRRGGRFVAPAAERDRLFGSRDGSFGLYPLDPALICGPPAS
jgi:hypothetical protein